MGRICWPAMSDGRYWVDLALGSIELKLMIDTGLTDRRHWVGLAVEPRIYDRLKAAGDFAHLDQRFWRDTGGRSHQSECGLTTAQLVDPLTKQLAGSVVRLYVARGLLGLPSRVGVVFFHRLRGCRVIWELDQRTWCVEYP